MEYNRLFWHSRRGMRELDILLVPFVSEVFPTLNAGQQKTFSRLLEFEDPILYSWFIASNEPHDMDLKFMVKDILRHARKAHHAPIS